jgi:hypothetical protein
MLEFDDNIGKEWSAIDMVDLRYSLERGLTVAEIACFLKRTDAEVEKKAAELGMALDELRAYSSDTSNGSNV